MRIIKNPHDRLFKNAMSDPRVASEFFGEHLPALVRAAIDLSSLALSPNSYVDEALRESSSDLLYKAQIHGQSAYVYLLCEHQSTVDTLMPLRLWQYMGRIWAEHLKQSPGTQDPTQIKPERPLPLIIPLVFYNGPTAYIGARHMRALINAPEALIDLMYEPFHLIDAHEIPDETLRAQKIPSWLSTLFLTFYSPLPLRERVPRSGG